MNPILYLKGTLFLLSLVVIFRLSFIYFKRKQTKESLLLILLGGTIIRTWCVLDGFLYAWDERYHALVAKNMMGNPLLPLLFKNPILPYNYQHWTTNHVWLHKQPLSLWLMSASLSVFGNVEWAVRLPSLILSVACIYLTYSIARFYTDEKTALLAAFFQSVNGLIIEIAVGRQSTDHIDNTFLFFIELSIWFTVLYVNNQKKWAILGIGVSMGLAFLTKSFPALIVLPIFFLLTIDDNKWLKTSLTMLLILIISGIIYMPWQLYIYTVFPQEASWENALNLRHLREVIEGHDGDNFKQILWMIKIWNELIYIVFAWFIYAVFKRKMDNKTLSLIAWIGIPYLFFSIVATKMIAYPLFTAPAIFIIEASFCWFLIEKGTKFLVFNKILLVAIIVLAIRYGYERVHPFKSDSFDLTTAESIKNCRTIFNKNDKNVVFNADNYVEFMFYHDNCVAYPKVPNKAEIDALNQLNYSIFIVNNSAIDTNNFKQFNVQFLYINGH
jgi:4-amino-4-deoxy-L-arabinose transferase-like glycosyltransferase